MSLLLNLEQIMALAPDASAASAGKGQANCNKWPLLGRSEQAVWGECQGSGKKPYQARVDLNDIAYHCSCPSRKLPCKHVLGLLLLLHNQPADFTETEPPPWVVEWLDKRAQRSQQRKKKASAPQKAADPAAQAKRADTRHARTAAGLQELELWLRDLLRQGLAAARSETSDFWAAPAARMVDAQAPGVARLLRQMATIPATGAGWEERLLLHIGRLYLLLQGFKRLDTLRPATQADIAAVLGWPQSQDELLAGTGIRDHWLVAGQRTEEEDKLRTQLTWLWGSTSHRAALILDFAFGSTPLDKSLVPDTCLDAELVFFPGTYPLRALVKTYHKLQDTPDQKPGYADIAAATDAYAAALAGFPWLERFPMLLKTVMPVYDGETWQVCDQQHLSLPCAPAGAPYWELLARSGGRPLDIFGEWDGTHFWPLNTWETPHQEI